MGEAPDRVFLVGAPGVDNVKRLVPLSRAEFEAAIGMTLRSPTLLVTYHPVTLSDTDGSDEIGAMLKALDTFEDGSLVFTQPNADAGGQAIVRAIESFVAARPGRAVFVRSLGQRLYLSALTHVDVVVGNSSSGLIEAPAAGVPTVNIGDRQKGRLRSASVIDCGPDSAGIAAAIRRAMTPEFRRIARSATPAYGAGDAARRICDVLATFPLDQLRRKVFHDVA